MAVCAAGGAVWCIYSDRIAPLAAQEKEASRSVAELRERVQAARKSVKEIHKLEEQALQAQAAIVPLPSDLPSGAALVWFPARLKKHFDRFGIAVGITRLSTVREEPHLPGYKRSFWWIELPVLKDEPTAAS